MRLGLGLSLHNHPARVDTEPPAPPFVGPLDGFTTFLECAICPGHRLLSSWHSNIAALGITGQGTLSFAGPAGPLDPAALTAAAGADARLDGAYDQSGHDRLFYNPNPTGGEARVITGGGFVPFGSGIGADFGWSGVTSQISCEMTIPQPFTVIQVLQFDAIAFGRGAFATSNLRITSSGTNLSMDAGAVLNGPAIAVNSKYIVSAVFNGAASRLRVNGVNGSVGNAGTIGLTSVAAAGIGRGRGPTVYFDGKHGATLIYSAALSDVTLAGIEAAFTGIFGSFP